MFQLSFFIEKKIGFIVFFFLVTRRSLSGGFTANKKIAKKITKKISKKWPKKNRQKMAKKSVKIAKFV